ncbi:MAG: hypothetical protein U0R76_12160 [Candidatus Nanopelagicales bacterium]
MEIDESRLPLTETAVRAALDAVGFTGSAPALVARAATADTLAAMLDESEPGGVLVAEQVSAGLGPVPHVPDGAALWVSTVVDVSGTPEERRGWLAPAAALAAVDALRDAGRVPAEITWPAGLTVPGAMCGGDAGTRALGTVAVTPHRDGSAVVTLGVLVSVGMLELPKRTTSVYADGGRTDRAALLAAYLPALQRRLAQWRDDDPALALAYRDRCQTLGRLVEVDGHEGRVRRIDEAGNLVVDVDGALRAVSADEPAPALV